jgi:serine/threonine protein kinase
MATIDVLDSPRIDFPVVPMDTPNVSVELMEDSISITNHVPTHRVYSISINSEDVLGKGTYSEVVRGTVCEYGKQTPLACKVYHLVDRRSLSLDHVTEAVSREKLMMRALASSRAVSACANIIKCMDSYVIQNLLEHPIQIFFMELLPNYTLEDMIDRAIEDDAHLCPHFIIVTISQLIHGLGICHNAKIAHGDIKPANIIYDEQNDRVVLFDFNLGFYDEPLTLRKSCSALYAGPEIVDGAGRFHNPYFADLWALGQTCFELITLESMFPDARTIAELVSEINSVTRPILPSNPQYDGYAGIFDTIVQGFIKKEPTERTSLQSMQCSIKEFHREQEKKAKEKLVLCTANTK